MAKSIADLVGAPSSGISQVAYALSMYYSENQKPVIPFQLYKYMRSKIQANEIIYFDKIISQRLYNDHLEKLEREGLAKNVPVENSKTGYIPTTRTTEISSFVQRMSGDSWKDVKWIFHLLPIKGGPIDKKKFYKLQLCYSCKKILREEDLEFVCVRNPVDQDKLIKSRKIEFVWNLSQATDDIKRLDKNYFNVRSVTVDGKPCVEASYKSNDAAVEIRYKIPKFELKKSYSLLKYEITTVLAKSLQRLYTIIPENTIRYSSILHYSKANITNVYAHGLADYKKRDLAQDTKIKKISLSNPDMTYAGLGTFFVWNEKGDAK